MTHNTFSFIPAALILIPGSHAGAALFENATITLNAKPPKEDP
jgi:hypothetical protein